MAVPARPLNDLDGVTSFVSRFPSATTEVRASDLWQGQRRMEAEAFLHEGYRIQASMERQPTGWTRLDTIATATTPPRIKQVMVSPKHGVPYLNTSQVFEPRPTARKWLAASKTSKATERLVKEGTILLMASATVGRAVIATKAHEDSIVSHHFMRVHATDPAQTGWLYAFLRSEAARAMMDATQYASVIRHIEPHHLHELPIPYVDDETAEKFQRTVDKITELRNTSLDKRKEAEDLYASALNMPSAVAQKLTFSVSASALAKGRRRFEADYHLPQVQDIIARFPASEPLAHLCEGIWWGKRFKRNYGKKGVPYLSADDLFTTNRYYKQYIQLPKDDEFADFRVKDGWLLMACSGQTYGLNGAVTIAGPQHEDCFFSHDLIRIIPKKQVRPGYLLIALTHPTLGRPVLIREAYGMSIPHLDPEDVGMVPIARLGTDLEDKIANLAEAAVETLREAEALEETLANDAQAVINNFLKC